MKIDESRVPEQLRDLIPYAKYWSIGDDVDRAELMARTSKAQKKELVDVVWPRLAELESWCEANDWSDEGVILTSLIQAAAEARVDIYPPTPAAQLPPGKPEPPLNPEQKAELHGYIHDLKTRAKGDVEQDGALLRETIGKVDEFWMKLLAELPPGQSRERIQNYLGMMNQPEAPQEPHPGLPAHISKELIELHQRLDSLLAQCKARESKGSPSDTQSRNTEPGGPPNGGSVKGGNSLV